MYRTDSARSSGSPTGSWWNNTCSGRPQLLDPGGIRSCSRLTTSRTGTRGEPGVPKPLASGRERVRDEVGARPVVRALVVLHPEQPALVAAGLELAEADGLQRRVGLGVGRVLVPDHRAAVVLVANLPVPGVRAHEEEIRGLGARVVVRVADPLRPVLAVTGRDRRAVPQQHSRVTRDVDVGHVGDVVALALEEADERQLQDVITWPAGARPEVGAVEADAVRARSRRVEVAGSCRPTRCTPATCSPAPGRRTATAQRFVAGRSTNGIAPGAPRRRGRSARGSSPSPKTGWSRARP